MSAIHVALIAAQKAAEVAIHNAENKHQKYNYTSGERMIAIGRRALHGAGLALVRESVTLHLVPAEVLSDRAGRLAAYKGDKPPFDGLGGAVAWINVKYLLMHESGETLPIASDFPVVPERGRPLDKAAAASDTECFAYTMRGVLLIERGPEGRKRLDVSGRNDAGAVAALAPARTQMAPAPNVPPVAAAPPAAAPLGPHGPERSERPPTATGDAAHPRIAAILGAETLDAALVALDEARKDRTASGFEAAFAAFAIGCIGQAKRAQKIDWIDAVESKVARAGLSASHAATVRKAIQEARSALYGGM